MKTLIDLLDLKPNERVLDIGAATGDMSRPAMEKNVKLTLLDDSPAMIKASRELFGNTAEYALCSAGDFENEDPIELAHPYDAIICHLALPSLAGDETELNRLAQWCAAHLHHSGRLGLACHNTAVKTPDSKFDLTDEPLRKAFKTIADRRGISASFRATTAPIFTPEQIEAAFNKAGFKVDKRNQEHYSMLMNDRLLMWSAPAVLDSLFRMEQLSNDDVKLLIDETRRELGAQQTPDMVVSFWIFRATNSSDSSG
jgi:cyclopropane fatty-acyl-phospholipid synthase-like methyltransferase